MLGINNPGSFEDVVELLIPELQKRGLYWNDYPVPEGGTLRENLHKSPGNPLLPADHPGAKVRWNTHGTPPTPSDSNVDLEVAKDLAC